MPIRLPRSPRNASVCSGCALPRRGLNRRKAGQSGLLARLAARRPIYRKLVKSGFLPPVISMPFGGDDKGTINIAEVAEEFSCNDLNGSLMMFAMLSIDDPLPTPTKDSLVLPLVHGRAVQ